MLPTARKGNVVTHIAHANGAFFILNFTCRFRKHLYLCLATNTHSFKQNKAILCSTVSLHREEKMATTRFVSAMVLMLLAILMVESKELAKGENGVEGEYHLDRAGAGHGSGSLRSYQCPSQCSRRCGRTQYKKPCLFFCNKCCRKCLCVPPGFYGNKEVCPCYNNWKTKEGGPKCP